jgi:hypothetical protein
MTLKLFLSCFAIGNTVKQPLNCLQYDHQTVRVLLLFCFVIVLLCYWKYSKETVQLSPIWHSNCPCLVIVLFCYWKYSKATFNCLQYYTQTVLVLLLFCFDIGNTVKQPFNCLQYDTQTVLILFCYWKYSKATVQLSPIWHSNCPCLVIVLFCYCFALLLKIQ